MRCREQESLFAREVEQLNRSLNWSLQKRGKKNISLLGVQLKSSWKGCLSLLYQQNKKIIPVACDILLVHPSQKSFSQGRKQPLINRLRELGLCVEETIECDDLLLKDRLFCAPPCRVPLSYRWPAAYAAYLLNKYQAKVIVTERNGWVVPSFIKWFRDKEVKIVHLAHSVLTGQSESYSYYDYDYYFLFGKSSCEYLAGLSNSFGECRAVYAGPYFFQDKVDFSFRLPERNDGLNLLFLAPGPGYEQKITYREQCLWIAEWLKQNKTARLSVKVHPRGEGTLWRKLGVEMSQIEVLPIDAELEVAAAQASLVLTGYTNAVIDISRVGRPFILLGDDPDYFSSERFSMPRVQSMEQLGPAVKKVLANMEFYEEKASCFFSYHVKNDMSPLSSLVDAVKAVVTGDVPEGAILFSKKA